MVDTVVWTEVESSNIDQIGYDEDRQELHVLFNSGSEYVYAGVSDTTVKAFIEADSKGKFLNQYIKGNYEYQKV